MEINVILLDRLPALIDSVECLAGFQGKLLRCKGPYWFLICDDAENMIPFSDVLTSIFCLNKF